MGSFKVGRLMLVFATALLVMNLGVTTTFAAHVGDIEKGYREQKSLMQEVDARLMKAEAYRIESAKVIAGLRASGYQTVTLDEAQADLLVHLQNIGAELQDANKLFADHPGFDANGKVVNRSTAKKTLDELKACEKDIRAWGGDIYYDMHHSYTSWAKLNPDAEFAEPTRPTNKSFF